MLTQSKASRDKGDCRAQPLDLLGPVSGEAERMSGGRVKSVNMRHCKG